MLSCSFTTTTICLMFLLPRAQAYFGLTGKTQLSNLWNINLDASSLAVADQFEYWSENSDEPAPSHEYKAIDMSLKPSQPIPIKRKRVASRIPHDSNTHAPTNFDQRSHRNSASSNERGTFLQRRPYNINQHNRRNGQHLNKNSKPKFPIRKATSSHRPSSAYSRRQTASQSSRNDREVNLGKQEEEAKKHGQEQFDVTEDEDNELSRDIGMIMTNHSFSMPRVRNERESGKRRDVYSLTHKPQQYLVASSVRYITPSQVGYGGGTGRQGRHPDRKPETTVTRPPFLTTRRQNGEAPSDNSVSATEFTSRNFDGRIIPLDENMISSYSAFVGSRLGNFTPMVEPLKIDKKVARKLCDTFKLTSTQRKKCKRDPGMPQVLAKATHLAAAECLFQFRYERWNCSLGSSRIHLLNKGNKETAFLYSISSAGLAYSVARACAEGHLEKCSCEESFEDHVNHEAWLWGGCGDNVRFAAKFTRRFLRPPVGSSDVRAEIDKHNTDLGIRFVKSNVLQTCKCHGVSGSCTTKTCWRKMAPFIEIGKKIKRAYNRAVKVENISNTSGRPKLVRIRRRTRRQKPVYSERNAPKRHGRAPGRKRDKKLTKTNIRNPSLSKNSHSTRATSEKQESTKHEKILEEAPKKKELVYIENSPPYCRRSRFSLGTKGRICRKESECERMCCGRGYTTHVRIIRTSCKCQVKWCCYVKCNTCNERKQIHTCK